MFQQIWNWKQEPMKDETFELLALPCGVVFEMGQSLTSNQNWPHMVLVTCSSSEIQLQVTVKLMFYLN